MKVADIDWDTWEPEELATLMFVKVDHSVLLIRKKRGLGAGKINGPGGRIEGRETPIQCAIRETREELDITPLDVRAGGELFFHSDDFPRIHGFVFTAAAYEGVPRETEEAIPLWTPVDRIPYAQMWEDDRFWLPQVLAGRVIDGWFTFTGETLLDHVVRVRTTRNRSN